MGEWMMRRFAMRSVLKATALAAVFGFAAVGAAMAEEWSSEDGRLQITVPDGWPVDIMSRPTDTVFAIAAGTASQECRSYVVGNPATEGATTQQIVRAFSTPFTTDQWAQIAQGVAMVRGGTVRSTSVDAAGFWPRQEALIDHEGATVYASLQGRPGYDIYSFCKTWDGPDAPDVYAAVLDSIGAAGDDAAEAAAAAAPPAIAPPPQ
jgi:hypothetical protein